MHGKLTTRPSQWPLACALLAVVQFATASGIAANPDGNFERGDRTPSGWQPQGAARWCLGDAHKGMRYLRIPATDAQSAWLSGDFGLTPHTDYRLEAWMRSPRGSGRLSLQLHSADRAAPIMVAIPAVNQVTRWKYVAAEFNSGSCTRAQVVFRSRGEADLDDLHLAPLATSYMGNKGVEADARGRIGFWGEETNEAILPGQRAGQWKVDRTVKREGAASLHLNPTADWYAYSTLNYAVPAWTNRVRLAGWARCEGEGQAQLLACWTDDRQQVVRVDPGPISRHVDWQRLELIAEAPPRAASVRLVAAAGGGGAWFDEFEVQHLRPSRRVVRVFANQVGYERTGPKSAVVATNFFPASGACAVTLQTAKGEAAWRGEAVSEGRIYSGRDDDWGWYFWRADFSNFTLEGSHQLIATCEGQRGQSAAFLLQSGMLLNRTAQPAVDFFYIQRCGDPVPGWHAACHLDDAKLPDGTHLDLVGGWHSAGDYNKLMYEHGDGGVAFALLSAFRAQPSLFARSDRDRDGVCDIVEESNWGARFVAKMQLPNGGVRNHVNQGPAREWMKWTAPEVHTDNKVGTADDPVVQSGEGNSPLVVGAWARLARMHEARGESTDYLARARRLWDHASRNGSDLGPHLLLSTLELHAVTGENRYREAAQRAVRTMLAQQVREGRMRGAFGSFGEFTAGALAQFVLAYPGDALGAEIRPALRRHLEFLISTADNPFRVSMHSPSALPPSPAGRGDGGEGSFFPPDMGANFLLLARAWAAAGIYRVIGDRRALGFATDQVDWLLGKNPVNLCMFEGLGAFNSPRYHHRYNMIPGRERGAVPGCVPNGFVKDMGLADRPGFDLSKVGGRSPSFRTCEPWLVHNLWYLMAMGELHRAVSASSRAQ